MLLLALVAAGTDGIAPPRPRLAAIVDQLSLTAPDPAFVAQATRLLRAGGYRVEYVPGDQVTVDFYRTLPQRHYNLIVLRSHSSTSTVTYEDTHQVKKDARVSLFTGEPYDPLKYRAEQDGGWLGHSRYLQEGAPALGVFGIEPGFIRYAMRGRFDHTLILMMGCDGVHSSLTADTFLAKGARAFVGWDDFVSVGHTDVATERLLRKLMVQKLPLRTAVAQIEREVGPDPTYGSTLQVVSRNG